MQKFLVHHTFPVGKFEFKDICQVADQLQHVHQIRGYRSFFNLKDGKGCCVLEANDREALADWFQQAGIPYDYILPVELEGEYGTVRDLREEKVRAGVV
jgi:hypothetical protein